MNKHRNFRMLTTFIVLLLFCWVNVYAQEQKVTVNVKSASLKEIFKEIEKQTTYRFSYRNVLLDNRKDITLSKTNVTVPSVLNEVFKGRDLEYKIVSSKMIAISEKTKEAISTGKSHKISGIVKDIHGEPIIGANVVVKGTTIGSITGIDGGFSFEAPVGATLTVTYIGYSELDIKINSALPLNLIMKENAVALDEVVAIGYGSTKKSDLTGAVSNISSKMLQNQARMNDPIQSLQGQVAGADITSSNSPGASSSIVIRGYNTLMRAGGDAPLIIVDNAPFLGQLDEINPAEIEKMDILKDASSTAIYGARGANGVIIITTKRGNKDSKLSVEYDGYFGMGKSYKNFDVMDGPTYAAYREAAYKTNGNNDAFDDVQKRVLENGNYIDWQKLMFNDWSYKTNHNVTVNTSTGKNRNVIVLGYNKDQGIIDNMSYDRFTGRFTGDLEFSKRFLIGYSVSLAHSVRDLGENNVWRNGTRMDPLSELYDEEGNMNIYTNKWMRDATMVNPIFDTKKENVDVQIIRNNISANVYADWELLKDLKLKSSFTYNCSSTETGSYFGSESSNRHQSVNGANFNKATHSQYNFTNILNYVKQLNEKHKLDVSLVHDVQKYETNALAVSGFDIPYYGKWYNVNEAQSNITQGAVKSEWALLSFMGRINYNVMDRYLFTATGRYDGSSRLAKGNKWAFFPSAALAWRISEESFVKDAEWVSNLKLRVSYGMSGNTAIAPYATQGEFGRYPYNFGTDEVAAWGYVPSVISNPGLGWERTGEVNIGVDYGFFDNRLSGSLDLYQRNTYDLLMERKLPVTTGYSSVWQNVGQIRNTGFELAIQGVPVQTKDFSLTIKATLSYNKNEIVKLFNGTEDSPGNNWFIGKPVNVDRFYKYLGVWQKDEADEAKKYKQVIGTTKLEDKAVYNEATGEWEKNYTYGTEDMDIYNKIPKWLAGLSLTAQYKNWDMSIYSYGRFDYGARMGTLTYDQSSTRFNQIGIKEFWTEESPTNLHPRAEMVNIGYLSGSSWTWRDLSFVRIKNINLGYTLPKVLVSKFGGKQVRAYVAVENPFLFTKSDYDGIGLDPENCNSEASARPLTTYMFGLNVKF